MMHSTLLLKLLCNYQKKNYTSKHFSPTTKLCVSDCVIYYCNLFTAFMFLMLLCVTHTTHH